MGHPGNWGEDVGGQKGGGRTTPKPDQLAHFVVLHRHYYFLEKLLCVFWKPHNMYTQYERMYRDRENHIPLPPLPSATRVPSAWEPWLSELMPPPEIICCTDTITADFT